MQNITINEDFTFRKKNNNLLEEIYYKAQKIDQFAFEKDGKIKGGDKIIHIDPGDSFYIEDIKINAADAVCVIKPKVVFPMHQSKKDPKLFKREMSVKSDTKVIILELGDEAYE